MDLATRPRLAIVGTGIAGLGCAHFLKEQFDLTLFEADGHVGGHSNTIEVEEDGRRVAFDTGFMVFNKVTYPHLTRLFEELGVPIRRTDMSFSVQHLPSGLEFCGTGLDGLFAQRRRLFSPSHYRFLLQIDRFNREAVLALEDPKWAEVTVQEYVLLRKYGEEFLERYLVPMSCAVWSTPPDRMLEFPVQTLLRFFYNHGFLGLHTQHPWWTVEGGAREYVCRLIRPFAERIRLNTGVAGVRRLERGGAEVTLRDGGREIFDRVILAGHADQSLEVLQDADVEERRLLGEFRYQENWATIHTDPGCMPRNRRAWASWNQRVEVDASGVRHSQTLYWMNRLQGLAARESYFVSIDGGEAIDPKRVIRRIRYTHPLFTLGAVRAQEGLRELNCRSPDQAVFFCGSYFRFGFHEDALDSAVQLVRILAGRQSNEDQPTKPFAS